MSKPTPAHPIRRKTDVFLPLDKRINYLLVLRELEEKLYTPDATECTVTLYGPDVLEPDFALGILDLLESRPTGMTLVTQAMSSLMESNLLLWLAGDVRILRPDAWAFFAPPMFPDEAKATRGKSKRNHPVPATFDVEDARVQELIMRHLPVGLGHRRLWFSELAEWIEVSPSRNDLRPPSPKYSGRIDHQLIDPEIFDDGEISF
jgi:hypothetical protein